MSWTFYFLTANNMVSTKPKTIEVLHDSHGHITCPKCGKPMILVEYSYDSPNHYDGVSEYVCIKKGQWGSMDATGCGLRVGRWSGKILTGKMQEKPFGGK